MLCPASRSLTLNAAKARTPPDGKQGVNERYVQREPGFGQALSVQSARERRWGEL